MNELALQAKELAEQAFREDNAKRFTVMEKFAELIVNRMIDNVECHADLYESPDIKFICEKIVNSIKFDFGVEE
jgi:hypothetical protein